MYIAFKWLVIMTLIMWITLCSIELYKNNINKQSTEYRWRHVFFPSSENSSNTIQQHMLAESKKRMTYTRNYYKSPLLQYFMFFGGVCVVFLINRKNNITMFAKKKIDKLKQNDLTCLWVDKFLKKTAIFGVAITRWMEKITRVLRFIKTPILIELERKNRNINWLLLNKLKEYSQDRRYLAQLLISTIRENKNVRMQYQLQTMAKQRLIKHIEDTQKLIKENRSRYVSFQQLYLVTYQENVFLKSRIKQLSLEKEDTERNLVTLVSKICQSTNSDLKVFCSRFIVQPKNNLLNSDVNSEIEQFLNKTSRKRLLSNQHTDNNLNSLPNKDNRIHKSVEENAVTFVKGAPKLRGLPGECIWTIKDKDGIIEKLYEYETDFDNCDTLGRIRQYSVYYDKECFLDISGSTTLLQNTNSEFPHSYIRDNIDCKRITGSQVFQKFLKNNKNILVQRNASSTPRLQNRV